MKKKVFKNVCFTNNFGKIGIHELSGTLNIGTTYEGDFSKQIQQKIKEKLGKKIPKARGTA